MKPLRQIESAELMIASNDFSLRFMSAILSITKSELLVSPEQKGNVRTHGSSVTSALETEHTGLVRGLKAIENSYGVDMLTLAVSIKYAERIAANANVRTYLEQTCPETLALLVELLQESRQVDHDAA